MRQKNCACVPWHGGIIFQGAALVPVLCVVSLGVYETRSLASAFQPRMMRGLYRRNTFIPWCCQSRRTATPFKTKVLLFQSENDDVSFVGEKRQEDKNSIATTRYSTAVAEAEALKAKANMLRLEAERSDVMLTLDKISILEKKLENEAMLEKHPGMENDLIRQLEQLQRRLSGSESSLTSQASLSSRKSRANDSLTAKPVAASVDGGGIKEELPKSPVLTDDMKARLDDMKELFTETQMQETIDTLEEMPQILRAICALPVGLPVDANSTEIAAAAAAIMDLEQFFARIPSLLGEGGELPDKERHDLIENLEKVPESYRSKITEGFGLPSDLNPTVFVDVLQFMGEMVPNTSTRGVNGTERWAADKRMRVEKGYGKLSSETQDLFAASVGMPNGRNATAVLARLEEVTLFSEAGKEDPVLERAFEEAYGVESAGVSKLFPVETRKDGMAPSISDVDEFITKALTKDTFNTAGKPIKVPGGYIIRGTSGMREGGGDELIKVLEERLAETSAAGKLRVHYVDIACDELLGFVSDDDLFNPVLFITGPDLAPETDIDKALVSLLAFADIAYFAIASVNFNQNIFDKMQATQDFDDFFLLCSSIFVGIFATQAAHEAGHRLVAIKEKIKVSFPRFVPSVQIGLTGAITALEEPPKNLKSLFDFALAGPIVGMLVSLVFLVHGCHLTANLDPLAQSQLPGISVDLLRSSRLVGGIVESLLGSSALLSPDEATSVVSLHPIAIAGSVGVIINALSLLPIGNTDGGRIAMTLFGRSRFEVAGNLTISLILMAKLLGFDRTNVLILYGFYSFLFQLDSEIPCKNEVDELDFGRCLIGIAAAYLTVLALFPLT